MLIYFRIANKLELEQSLPIPLLTRKDKVPAKFKHLWIVRHCFLLDAFSKLQLSFLSSRTETKQNSKVSKMSAQLNREVGQSLSETCTDLMAARLAGWLDDCKPLVLVFPLDTAIQWNKLIPVCWPTAESLTRLSPSAAGETSNWEHRARRRRSDQVV
mgnify:CR=1 FL=1